MNLKKILSALVAGTMVASAISFNAMAADKTLTVGSDGDYATLTEALADLNGLTGDIEIALSAETFTENVTVCQVANQNLTISGVDGTVFNGTMTIHGNGRVDGAETLVIDNIDFDAKGIDNSCIMTAASASTSYSSHNVTISNCEFTDSDNGRDHAAIKEAKGSEYGWAVKNCTVDETMHSLLQAKNFGGSRGAERGIVIDGCKVYSKNGISLSNTVGAEIKNCIVDVDGYAVRVGENEVAEEKIITLTNNTLKTANADDEDAVILARAGASNATVTMENNIVVGEPSIKTATEDITFEANYNYWGGDAPVVDGVDIGVVPYYTDEEMTTIGGVAAEVDGTYYATLQEALKAVKADSVVNILSDITITENWDNRYTGAKFTVPVTINGNDNTIKFTSTIDDKNYFSVFRFEADAEVYDLTFDLSEAVGTSNRFRAISAKANLIVDGCTFIGNPEVTNTRAVIFGEGSGAAIGDVDVTITDSEFTNWKRGITDNEAGQDAKSVMISGNEFESADVYVSAWENVTFKNNEMDNAWVNITAYKDASELKVVVTGNTLEENNGTKANYIGAGAEIEVQEGFEKAPAYLNGKGCKTLEAALNAAQAGDKVTISEGSYTMTKTSYSLPDDVTIEGVGEVVLNNSLKLTGNNIYLKNVDIVSNGTAFAISGNGVIEDCEFEGNNGARNCYANNGNVTFRNCVITGRTYGLHFDAGNGYGEVIVENCTLTGWNSFGSAIEKLTITGTTFKHSGSYGQFRPYNNTTVTDCTFETTMAIDFGGSATYEFNNCTTTDGSSFIALLDKGDLANSIYTVKVDGEVITAETVTYPAKIGETLYDSLQDAINSAVAGDVVVMQGDVTENIVVGEENGIALMSAEGITLDLNGYTLTGSVYVNAGETIEIKNGAIVKTTAEEPSAVESVGNVTLTDVDITSARHAVRIEGGSAVINSGDYKVVSDDPNKTVHAVNVSGDSVVVINDGTFTGPAGYGVDSGSAVCVQSGATVTINGGMFTGGKNETLISTGTLEVYGGYFDQNPTYLADGYKAIVYSDTLYKVVNEALDTTGISVYFRPVANDVASERVYEIVLKAADGQEIYEWASADLTFALESDTIEYSIEADDNVTLTKKGKDRYMFNMDGINEYERTGNEVVIGKVTFAGYGSFSFAVADETTNVVMATEVADSIAKEFTVGGEYALTINGTDIITDNDVDTDDLYGDIEDEEIAVPQKKLTINVTFNNKINDNEAEYQAMWVVISGGDLKSDIVKNFGTDENALNNGVYTVEADLTEGIVYNVTVTGAGYRTAKYAVEMNANKTLNFWNNVKDVADEIEDGVSASTQTTFLAGDIVADNVINVYDLSAVVSYFGTEANTANNFAMYDLNRDKMIDSRDVAYVLVSWGK